MKTTPDLDEDEHHLGYIDDILTALQSEQITLLFKETTFLDDIGKKEVITSKQREWLMTIHGRIKLV